MKQSEIEKVMEATFRTAIKPTAWKKVGGFLYCRKEKLFFTLIILGIGKTERIHYSLDYKYSEFDGLFWPIVQLPENAKRPLSFRAQGAWVFPSFRVDEGELPNADWEARHLEMVVGGLLADANRRSSEMAERIGTPDQNLEELEKLYAEHVEKHPGSLVDINREKVMTAILNEDIALAKRIVRERIDRNDTGGFGMGGKTFYQLADEYLAAHSLFGGEGTSGS
jgi:hypothetical protein